MSGIKKMLLNFDPQTRLLPQTEKKKKKTTTLRGQLLCLELGALEVKYINRVRVRDSSAPEG